ncbi:MAG: hypothetical protein ACI92G_003101, partial [Candidatus Pelagisphaera sp.]
MASDHGFQINYAGLTKMITELRRIEIAHGLLGGVISIER